MANRWQYFSLFSKFTEGYRGNDFYRGNEHFFPQTDLFLACTSRYHNVIEPQKAMPESVCVSVCSYVSPPSYRDMDWSIDNSSLLSASVDGTARLWRCDQGTCIRTITSSHPLTAIRFQVPAILPVFLLSFFLYFSSIFPVLRWFQLLYEGKEPRIYLLSFYWFLWT